MKYKSFQEVLKAKDKNALPEFLKERGMTMSEFCMTDEYWEAKQKATKERLTRPFPYSVVEKAEEEKT